MKGKDDILGVLLAWVSIFVGALVGTLGKIIAKRLMGKRKKKDGDS